MRVLTREELLALIDSLEPSAEIAQALAFIRIVVKNNPLKTADQIAKRPDVQQALKVIEKWTKAAEEVAVEVMSTLPVPTSAMARDLGKTLDDMESDVQVNQTNVDTWRLGETSPDSWAARIMLRMSWLVDWLRKTVGNLTLDAPYKRWVSRLADNTCRYCRDLHGVVVPMKKSFAPEAKKIGFTRTYGGLYSPPLHPRCQCFLAPVFQVEYDLMVGKLTDTSNEEK